jgi:hypothetical protein
VALSPEGSWVEYPRVFSWNVDQAFPVCCAPQLAIGEGSLWISSGPVLTAVDPATGEIRNDLSRPGGFHARSVAVGFGRVFTTDLPGLHVASVHTSEDLESVRLERPNGVPLYASDVAVSDRGLWVTFDGFDLGLVDPERGRVLATVEGTQGTIAVEVERVDGADLVWAVDPGRSQAFLVDPREGTIRDTFVQGGDIRDVAAGEGRLWILDATGGIVRPIDPETGPLLTARVGREATALTVGMGALWVAHADGQLWQIDVDTREPTIYEFGAPLADVALDAETGVVWLAISEV